MIKVSLLPYLHHMAYSSGEHASDYQTDQLAHGLSSLHDVQFQQLPKSPILYKTSSREEIKKAWGGGYTHYGLLEDNQVNFDVGESDLIICSLHWSMTRDEAGFGMFIRDVKRHFNKPVIAIDGWDMTEYSEQTASLCPYFKRELTDDRSSALPIFFAHPEEKFYNGWVDKTIDFSDMIPCMFSWKNNPHGKDYHKYKTEIEYYQQYRSSYFGYNCCKAGWQSGRLLEIIANKCLPYFTDIEKMPKQTWHSLPRELLIDIKRMRGVNPGTISPYNPSVNTYIGDTRQIKPAEERGSINFCEFDPSLWCDYMKELFNYSLKNLTTKALARYVLEKSL